MNSNKSMIKIGLLFSVLVSTVLAWPLQPPQKGVDDEEADLYVGQTLTLDGEGKYYCLDGGQSVEEYKWVLPPEAYCISGQDTSELKCKFFPAGTYEVQLQVRCNYGIWNYEQSDNQFKMTVTVYEATGTWYVSSTGSDDNNGRSIPQAFASIQTAVDSATEGDTVIVSEGTYVENTNLKGKNITVQSRDPGDWETVRGTILDKSAVAFAGSETADCKFQGFTLSGNDYPSGNLTGLQGQWKFDNDYTDSSSYGRNGTNSGASFGTGRIEQAADFNGSSHVYISGYTGISGGASRTCSAWIKTASTQIEYILCWGTAQAGQFWALRLESSGTLSAAVYAGYVTTTRTVNDGQWHHVAAVLDSDENPTANEILLYIDGILQSTTASSSQAINTGTSQDVKIGVLLSGGVLSGYFNGKIDDVRIYDRALSGDEILHMDGNVGLAGHWTLDGNADDSSGNQLNGTSNGTPEYSDEMQNQTMVFDGTDDYVELPSGIINPAQDSFSAFVWVKLENRQGSASQLILSQKDNGTEPGRGWLARNAADDTLFSYLGGNYTSSSTAVFSTTDQWHLVGITYDSQTVRLYCDGQECGYSNRTAESCSGGLFIGRHKGSDPDTHAYWNGLIDDVRIYNRALSVAEIEYQYFGQGGAIRGNGTLASLSNCIIRDKHSIQPGAGIFRFNGTISNCLLVDNISDDNGGAFYGCDGLIENCTVVNNTASAGGGLYDCDGTIKNCIIWGNTGGQVDTSCANNPTYSCIQGWTGAPDESPYNIGSNPVFKSGDEQYHLDSVFDPAFPVYSYGMDDPIPGVSPCIDAGDSQSSYSFEPYPNGNQINMGVYGNTLEAEISPNSDNDGDGLTYYQEMKYSSDPYQSPHYDISDDNPDSDGDGMPDGWEIDNELNPGNASDGGQTDSDTDGILNVDEYRYGTDPHASDANYDVIGKGITNKQAINAGLDLVYEHWIGASAIYTEGFVWTQYYYPSTGGEPNEVVYVLNKNSTDANKLVIRKFSEIHRVCDDMGRIILERKLASPNPVELDQSAVYPGTINGSTDNIKFTMYYLGGEVKRVTQKGVQNGVGNAYTGNPFTDLVEPPLVAGDPNTGYQYDDQGRLAILTTAINANDLKKTYYYYDYVDDKYIETVIAPGNPGNPGDPDYLTTTTYYDQANHVVAVTDPAGHYRQYQYDSLGHVITDTLYADNTPTTVVSQNRRVYDNLGTLELEAVMDVESSRTTPDALFDRLTYYSMDYTSLNKTQAKTVYSSTGDIVDYTWAETDADSDASGRGLPTKIQKGCALNDPIQPTVLQFMKYNAAGQRTLQKTVHCKLQNDYENSNTDNIIMVATETQYDDYGRVWKIVQLGDLTTSLDNLTTTYSYDGLGRKILTTDPKNIQTKYAYNIMGQLFQKIEDSGTGGLARPTTYSYDRLGNMTSIVANDGTNNQTTAYQYDLLGRVDYIDYPDDTYIDYVYYASGKVENRIQGDSSPSSVTTHYIYDNMGNLRYKQNDPTSPTIVESYSYYANGLMDEAKKGTSAGDDSISYVKMYYNGLGYMTKSTQRIGSGASKDVLYDRDQLGQMKQLTIPISTPVDLHYTYTSLGQIDKIYLIDEENPIVDYSYKGTFVTGRSYATPSVVNFTPDYDDFGRLTESKTLNGSGQGVDFVYTYGYYDTNTVYHNGDNILSQNYKHRSTTTTNGFDYDGLNRLTTANYLAGTAGSELFDYDLLGNRNGTNGYTDTRPEPDVTCSYEHDSNSANEYKKIGGVDVLYDAAGDLTRDKNGYKYAYDYENRLTQISRSDNVLVATFQYDALGRRIEKKDMLTGTAKRYYYDDQRIALQTSVSSGGSETDEKYFIYGNYIDEVLVMHNLAGTNTGDFYYGHDHLYSPVVLFGSDGTPIERYEYDVYGKVRIFGPGPNLTFFDTDDESRSISAYGNPYTFTGRELDSVDNNALKVMYYRARSYDPQTGRFLQRDPLGVNPTGGIQNPFKPRKQYLNGMNLYDYVNDRPIVLTDPTGQNPIVIIVVGGVIYTAEEIASVLATAAVTACLLDPDCAGEVLDALLGRAKAMTQYQRVVAEYGCRPEPCKEEVYNKLSQNKEAFCHSGMVTSCAPGDSLSALYFKLMMNASCLGARAEFQKTCWTPKDKRWDKHMKELKEAYNSVATCTTIIFDKMSHMTGEW